MSALGRKETMHGVRAKGAPPPCPVPGIPKIESEDPFPKTSVGRNNFWQNVIVHGKFRLVRLIGRRWRLIVSYRKNGICKKRIKPPTFTTNQPLTKEMQNKEPVSDLAWAHWRRQTSLFLWALGTLNPHPACSLKSIGNGFAQKEWTV